MAKMRVEGMKSQKSRILGKNDVVWSFWVQNVVALVSVAEKKIPKTSLCNSTTEKMETEKEKNLKMLVVRCYRREWCRLGSKRLRRTFDKYDPTFLRDYNSIRQVS